MLARFRKSLDSDKGFTLIELLVVMIIIGILAMIAIPTFMNQRKKGYQSAVKSDLSNAIIAVESWAVDNGGLYQVTGNPAQSLSTSTNLVTTVGVTTSKFVTLAVGAVTPTTICIQATHEQLGAGEPWRIRRGEGTGFTPDKEPVQAAC